MLTVLLFVMCATYFLNCVNISRVVSRNPLMRIIERNLSVREGYHMSSIRPKLLINWYRPQYIICMRSFNHKLCFSLKTLFQEFVCKRTRSASIAHSSLHQIRQQMEFCTSNSRSIRIKLLIKYLFYTHSKELRKNWSTSWSRKTYFNVNFLYASNVEPNRYR